MKASVIFLELIVTYADFDGLVWRSQKRDHMCLVWSCYTKSYHCSPLLLCKDERICTIVGILAATASQSCVMKLPSKRTNGSRKETPSPRLTNVQQTLTKEPS